MSLEDQAHLAVDLLRAGNWQQLNVLLAQSPKSTDPEALRAIQEQDSQGVESLLEQWEPEWKTPAWSERVNAEAIQRSSLSAISKAK